MAFFTSAFQFRWNMYREGDDVFVQEQLLVPTDPLSYDPSNPFRIMSGRRSASEEAEQISEWRLRADDFQDFLDRRSRVRSE